MRHNIEQSAFLESLIQRLLNGNRFKDRDQYIGASEIGICLRHVVASKRSVLEIDPQGIGRMLAGRAMENEAIQLVRIALDGQLRETGRHQRDLVHSELPFHAHPDGRIVSEDGDGVLEVKTASANTFKRYQDEGLPQNYLDQVQAQMGLSGLAWGLVVLVSRENLAEMETFELRFDPNHFSRLVERARIATQAFQNSELPEGEPDRGFCFNCPYSVDCPQYMSLRLAGARGEIPEVERLKLEALMEELAGLETNLSPLEKRVAELRSQVQETLYRHIAKRVTVENGMAQLVESTRTSFDSKKLQREAPEIYSRFQKTSTYSNLRITFRGASKCKSTEQA